MPRLRFFSAAFNRLRDVFGDPIWRFQLSLLLLVLLTLGGALVYMLIEGWSFEDALYMTVITIGTVGYGEVAELSPAGRGFTIVLIILGIGTATSAISNAVSLALGPVLWLSLKQRRMKRMMRAMHDHYIVCGYGRMGRQITRDLQARNEPFVLIEADEETGETLARSDVPFLIGDATEDDVLLSAGVERARGLIAALPDDASNIMTVLTARELNPNVFIVARVVRAASETKLYRAGADRVINPYQIGGHRMALSLLRPAVNDFLDHIFHFGEGPDIDIGQIEVRPQSDLNGQTIASCNLRRDHNVNILAIQQADGQIVITPAPTTTLEPHMTLIVIGPPQAIYQLERRYRTM